METAASSSSRAGTRKARQMRLTAAHVAALPAKVELPPPTGVFVPRSDEQFREAAAAVLAGGPQGEPAWVFGFGSLIWKPGFEFVERRTATVRGWHRDYCLGMDRRFRGNPDNPGYTLSLDRGGTCKGVVFRLPTETAAAEVEKIIRREPPFPPRWLTAVTPQGPVRAFVFIIERSSPAYVGNVEDGLVADHLATAVGILGSSADYLRLTVQHLEELGICDDRLWRMQQMVAERIEAAHPEKFGRAG